MRALSASSGNDEGLRGFIRSINRFFFEPGDTATLGLIRVCAGFLILYVHLVYSYDLYRFCGKDAWISYDLATDLRKDYPFASNSFEWKDPQVSPPKTMAEAEQLAAYKQKWGIDKRLAYDQGQYVWSVWYHVTDPRWMIVVHTGILVCMLLFALGLWTPVTGVVTWLGMLSYVNRANTTFFGMDTVMNVLVIYLTLAHLFARPGTAALSLDRLLWRWRRARQTGLSISEVGVGETLSTSATFAIRLMQIHFCIIYLASGLSKLQGPSWWNGTALWYVVANYEFTSLRLDYYYKLISWLSGHRMLWEIAMTGGAAYTLVLEISLPFLIWNPRLRWLMVTGAVLLHTGIALVMGLTSFSLMMLALLVSFIPPTTVRQLLGMAERVPSLVPSPPLAPTPAGAVGLRT
jgi:hypothetical protein